MLTISALSPLLEDPLGTFFQHLFQTSDWQIARGVGWGGSSSSSRSSSGSSISSRRRRRRRRSSSSR